MQKTVWYENFIRYIKSHLTKVLLFAVLVSTGFTMNLVTKAKYISYVNDYHHAVAGEFYFTSNYLEEERINRTYSISNWDRDEYEVTLLIYNFENAYLYNDQDTGCYYCVEAKMYTDENYNNEDTTFVSTITYETNAETIGYNGKTYVYLPGQSGTFSKDGGTQTVKVQMKANEKVSTSRYMKITAKTLPVAEMYKAVTSNPDMVLPTGPVFEAALMAKFKLNIHTGANIETQLNVAAASSEVIYDLKCNSTDGGAASVVRVYYDSAKVKFEDYLKYETGNRNKYTGDTYQYVEFDVYSTSITRLIFFKRKMNDTIDADKTADKETSTIYYEVLRNGEVTST